MELRLVLAALRRNGTFVLGLALLGLVAAAALLNLRSGQYVASATLLLDPLAVTTPLQPPFSGDPERYIGGQLRVLESTELAERAAARLPGQNARSIQSAVSLDHVTGSDVVDITARADSSEVAEGIANTLADTYVQQRRSQTGNALKAEQDRVDAQIATVERAIAALTIPASTGTLTPRQAQQQARQQAQQQVLLAQYQQLVEQRSDLLAPSATSDKSAVIDPATSAAREGLPLVPSLTAGLILGGLLGLGLMVAREGRTPHVSGREDVHRVLGTPAVAAFPAVGGRRRGGDQQVIEALVPSAQSLAALVAVLPAAGKRRLVGVCSAQPGAGCSTVASSLAVAFAHNGLDVVIVYAGTPPRVLQPPTGADRGVGWLAPTAWDRIRTVTLGTADSLARPEEVLGAVQNLPPECDLVVVDLPPMLVSPIGAVLASWWDDLIVVVPTPDERQQELELVAEMLSGAERLRMHPVVNAGGSRMLATSA